MTTTPATPASAGDRSSHAPGRPKHDHTPSEGEPEPGLGAMFPPPIDGRLLRRANIAPLLLVNLGVAVHATIWYMASTAMPSAVQALDAAPFISWATSVYLVSSILGGALIAPCKARFGAHGSMLAASAAVIAGGLMAAFAPAIWALLVGRAMQGLGEGVLVALSYALVRELFPNRLVPRVFATQAASWGAAIVLGPLLAGWLTEWWSWRVAFAATALLPIPMQVLGWMILRRRPAEAGTPRAVPGLRLLLLCAGVLAIVAADRVGHVGFGLGLVLVGFALIAAMLRVDRRAAQHLFPTAFPNLRHPASLGLWVLLLMPLSEAPVYVYGPYLLQLYRDLTPMQAGYFGAIHAVAWTCVAIAIGPLSVRWQNHAIVAGPATLVLGLALLAVTLAQAPLPWVALAMVLVGTGFGLCNSFLSQRIMSSAQVGQEDATAGAIPTMSGLGGAISAALGGLTGNAVGLGGPLDARVVGDATLALFGGGAVLALLAVWLAVRLLGVLAAPPVQGLALKPVAS